MVERSEVAGAAIRGLCRRMRASGNRILGKGERGRGRGRDATRAALLSGISRAPLSSSWLAHRDLVCIREHSKIRFRINPTARPAAPRVRRRSLTWRWRWSVTICIPRLRFCQAHLGIERACSRHNGCAGLTLDFRAETSPCVSARLRQSPGHTPCTMHQNDDDIEQKELRNKDKIGEEGAGRITPSKRPCRGGRWCRSKPKPGRQAPGRCPPVGV